jgi:hypothetical protein
MSRLRELERPAQDDGVGRHDGGTCQRMHPLREVVEILAIPIPFLSVVRMLPGGAFVQSFADTQSAGRWMQAPLHFIEPADPARKRVVVCVPAKGLVNLLDQLQRKIEKRRVPGYFEQRKEIPDCKGVRPKVASRLARIVPQTCAVCEIDHDCPYFRRSFRRNHGSHLAWNTY